MRKEATTWRNKVLDQMRKYGDSWDAVEKISIVDGVFYHENKHEYEDKIQKNRLKLLSGEDIERELDREFFDGFGGAEGAPFTIWTRTRVYFPTEYDGSEWVSSVPRNPCDEVIQHVM